MRTFDLNKNENGFFEVKKLRDFFALYFCGVPVIEDSSEEMFNDFIDDYASEQGQKTLAKAIEEGYEYNCKRGFDENIQEAEYFLIDNCEGEFEFCELGNNGYSYGDYVCSGEIFDFGHYSANKKVYFRKNEDGSFTPVDWFEVPSHGEEGRSNYIFVFDTIVYDGEVLKLYDVFA